jgi:hypothetical protein
MNPAQLVADYLDDEEKLYQDWFAAVSQPQSASATIPVGIKDSVAELKLRAQNWFNANRAALKEMVCRRRNASDNKTLCERWLAMRNVEHFHVKQEMVVALTVDVALSPLFHPCHTLVVVTVLVVNGYLDALCRECPNR